MKRDGRRLRCPKCKGSKTRKMGILPTKEGNRQRWRCVDCKHSWSKLIKKTEVKANG